jgi:hypothetical protein
MTNDAALIRATDHLANYAHSSGMTLTDFLNAYMDGTLPAIKNEAVGRIMAHHSGVHASDVWAALNPLD